MKRRKNKGLQGSLRTKKRVVYFNLTKKSKGSGGGGGGGGGGDGGSSGGQHTLKKKSSQKKTKDKGADKKKRNATGAEGDIDLDMKRVDALGRKAKRRERQRRAHFLHYALPQPLESKSGGDPAALGGVVPLIFNNTCAEYSEWVEMQVAENAEAESNSGVQEEGSEEKSENPLVMLPMVDTFFPTFTKEMKLKKKYKELLGWKPRNEVEI